MRSLGRDEFSFGESLYVCLCGLRRHSNQPNKNKVKKKFRTNKMQNSYRVLENSLAGSYYALCEKVPFKWKRMNGYRAEERVAFCRYRILINSINPFMHIHSTIGRLYRRKKATPCYWPAWRKFSLHLLGVRLSSIFFFLRRRIVCKFYLWAKQIEKCEPM